VVGVDAGKFSHTVVIRPRGQADSKPFSFPTTRAGFEAAVAFLRQQAPGAALGSVLVGIEFAGNYGFTFAHFLVQLGERTLGQGESLYDGKRARRPRRHPSSARVVRPDSSRSATR
jgi:hypothetical protein